MPKVSVIIPTHNRALSLCRAVDSVLNQTFQDFEIVIVDDGSTDRTAVYALGGGDPRIRYHRHQTNRGEAASRNSGLRLARGDYIAFIDDDDEWLPEKLAEQVAVLDAAPAQVGLVYTGYTRIDLTNGRPLGTALPQARGQMLGPLCARNCVGGPSVVLVRRACFERVGEFDEALPFGVDYDMWIRVAREYLFDYVRAPLVRYALHANRMSMNHARVWRGKEAQLERYESYFAADPKAFSRYLLMLGVLRCYNGKLSAGRAAFWRAIRNNPYEPRAYFNTLLTLAGTANYVRLKNLKERLTGKWRAGIRFAVQRSA